MLALSDVVLYHSSTVLVVNQPCGKLFTLISHFYWKKLTSRVNSESDIHSLIE